MTGDKWSIALLYAKEYDSIDSDYYSDKPTDGNKFLVLFFDVKNVSAGNEYFNNMYFEGYVDDASTTMPVSTAAQNTYMYNLFKAGLLKRA